MCVCVCVCFSEEEDWWEAESVDNGQTGLVPRNFVVADNNNKESQTYV